MIIMAGSKRILWMLFVAAAAFPPSAVRGQERSRPPVAWTAYRAPVQFEALSIEQGLSQSSVVAILQDRKGFLWFGTDNGLNRYDGYDFRVFRNDPSDPDSIGDSKIVTLLEDSRGRLWVGTNYGGLNLFDRDREAFVRARLDPANPRSLSSNGVTSLLEDRNGDIWVGTSGNGLNRLARGPANGGPFEFDRFAHDPSNPASLGGDYVNALYEDRFGDIWIGLDASGLNRLVRAGGPGGPVSFARYPGAPGRPAPRQVTSIGEDDIGELWIGASDGLYLFDRGSGSFIRFGPDPRDPKSLGHEYVRCLRRDVVGTLWIGTDGGGLNELVPGRKPGAKPNFLRFRYDDEDPNSLPGDAVESIWEDRSGVLWVGLYYGGLAKLILNDEPSQDREKRPFINYYSRPSDADGLGGGPVNAILEDRLEALWVGTDGGGLSVAEPPASKEDEVSFAHFRHDPKNSGSLSDDVVTALFEDSRGDIWVGTYTGGLNRLAGGLRAKTPPAFTHYRHDPRDLSSLSNDFVMSIFEDSSGALWVGTIDGGLDRFDKATEKFTRFQGNDTDPETLSDNSIFALREDVSGALWVGTADGLNRMDRRSGTFTRYLNDPDDLRSIGGNSIRALFTDRKGSLWIGTDGAGLNRMIPGDGAGAPTRFLRYRIRDGLPSDVVFGILEDALGRLWLSTDAGLSCFDPDRETFRNYSKDDGLQSNEFHRGASFMNRAGEMFFGGYHGFNVFRPENIRGNRVPPQVVIKDFQLFNRSVPIGRARRGAFALRRSILETEAVELGPGENSLSFEFAALHFVSPDRNEYAYKLEGLDKDWNRVGTRRFATYSALPPGTYTFRVRAANGDGIWNEDGATLGVVIRHPFWQIWWFYTLVAAVGLGLLAALIRYRTRVVIDRARKLERTVEDRTGELRTANVRLAASVKEKDVLIKEIHHRVKNNMQVVSSLLNLQAASVSDVAVLDIIKKSRDRVLSMALIHEKLYQSRDLARIDFEQYLRKLIVHLFNSYRVDPGTVDLRIDVKDVYLDINTGIPCALIANELVSNALKYAFPAGRDVRGEIAIAFRRADDGPYALTIRDNGVGLPAGFGLETSESLGLQIVQDLVAQLDGTIRVENQGGTIYTITFPGPPAGADGGGDR
jgi:two-component sensor histidine kinase/ligand-binding sensor domain-containing protein